MPSDKKTDAKEMEKKPQNEGAIVVSQYDDDAGGGYEQQDHSDRMIPFLNLLQDGSPQVKKRDPGHIPGADPGMFLNSVSNHLWPADGGPLFIACATEHFVQEWVPRDKGGGFVGRHALDAPIVVEARAKAKSLNELMSPAGNNLVETFFMYCLVPEVIGDPNNPPATVGELINLNEIGEPIIIPFSSTKIKPYKQINTQIGTYRIPNLPHPRNIPPLWCHVLRVRSELEKRTAGDSFNYRISTAMGPKIELSKLMPRLDANGNEYRLYTAAREFRNIVMAGRAKVDYSGGEGNRPQGGDDDVPF